jgi:hypothetical protein
MTETPETLYAQEYFEYLHKRGRVRIFIRKIYLKDIQKYCTGKTIDMGCGTGELLKILPPGSIGFEVNKVAVDFCNSLNLKVLLYDPEKDDYKFQMINKGEFETFTMNHVLEHIENSHETIKKIFESCNRLEIKRIVFTVPGYKGFKSDKTHRTYITKDYLKINGLFNNKYYKLNRSKYFPVNSEKFGHFFTHNELRLVFNIR